MPAAKAALGSEMPEAKVAGGTSQTGAGATGAGATGAGAGQGAVARGSWLPVPASSAIARRNAGLGAA